MLLLISPNREFRKMLLRLGVLNLQGTWDTALALAERYDISGAFLDGWEEPEPIESLCRDLRENYPEMPIAVRVPPSFIPDFPADLILRDPDLGSAADAVREFCRQFCHWREVLQTYYLSVGIHPEDCFLLGYPLSLSPTEHLILRTLFYLAPGTVSSAELLKICFPDGTQQCKNLSVQISAINKAAFPSLGFPLIRNVYAKGYRLAPELFR